MPNYSITLVPYNDIHLRSGRVVEPLVIDDFLSFASEERMNKHYLSNAEIPIIEDAESPTETPAETHKETTIETQPTQLIRELPYLERPTL